jgi:hypothetical protein
MPLWQTIIALVVLVLGGGFGLFILLRLRAEPEEDPDDMERVRSIEEGLGLRKRPKQRSGLLLAAQIESAQALLNWAFGQGGLLL